MTLEKLGPISLSICLAILSASLVASGWNAQELGNWHREMVAGVGGSPGQYRLIAFWVPEVLVLMGLPILLAYACVHGMATGLTLIVVGSCVGEQLRSQFMAIGLAAAWQILSFEPVIQVADPWSLLAASLVLWSALRLRAIENRLAIAILSGALILSALSREIVFCLALGSIPLVWMRTDDIGSSLRLYVLIWLPGIVTYALTHLLLIPHGAPRIEALANLRVTSEVVMNFSALLRSGKALLALKNLFWVLIVSAFLTAMLPGVQRRMGPALTAMVQWGTIPFLMISLCFGISTELRIFGELGPMFALVAVRILCGQSSAGRPPENLTGWPRYAPLFTGMLQIPALWLVLRGFTVWGPTNGFYHAEPAHEGVVRWMDRRGVLAVRSIDPAGNRMLLPIRSELPQSIRIHVESDGVVTDSLDFEVRRQWLLLDLELPGGEVYIEIRADSYFVPAAFGSEDRRVLSILVGQPRGVSMFEFYPRGR